MIWTTGSYAPFSISRAYETLSPLPIQPNSIVQFIWQLTLPGKMKFHLWRLYHKSLPVVACLARFLQTLLARCVICGHDTEYHMHLFRDCPFASVTWTKFLPQSDAKDYELFFSLDWPEWIRFNLSFTLSPHWP